MKFTEWVKKTEGCMNVLEKIIRENDENLENNREWDEKIKTLEEYIIMDTSKIKGFDEEIYTKIKKDADKFFEMNENLFI